MSNKRRQQNLASKCAGAESDSVLYATPLQVQGLAKKNNLFRRFLLQLVPWRWLRVKLIRQGQINIGEQVCGGSIAWII